MKKWIVPVVISLILAAIVFGLVGYGFYYAFFDIQRYEGHEEIGVSQSPTGAYTVTAYRNNGGGTSGYAILCTVTDHATGETRNIYWDGKVETADIQWKDQKTVVINTHELDVVEDTYDYRRQKENLP